MFKVLRKIIKNERGASLVEVVIALGLLGLIATMFLMAIFIATESIAIADERTTAESLARAQMESIKQQEYDDLGGYTTIGGVPNYDVDYTVEEIHAGLQKITVEIGHPGEAEPVLTLEGYKVDEGVY